MLSIKIDILERGNDVAIRAVPICEAVPSAKEAEIGYAVALVVKQAMHHLVRVHGDGAIVTAEIDSEIRKTMDAIFDNPPDPE